jgi:hypothetical protein
VNGPASQRPELWPWIGLAGVILGFVATWVVLFIIPEADLNAGGEALLDSLDKGSNDVIWRVSSGLGYLGVACLIFYAAGLKRWLDSRSTADDILPNVLFASLLVTSGALIVAWALRAQVFDGIGYYDADPSSHVTINRLSQDTGLAAWAGVLAGTVATAIGGIRGSLFPTWLGWLSALAALIIAVLCLGGVAFPANIPAGIWLLALTIWTISASRERPASQPV